MFQSIVWVDLRDIAEKTLRGMKGSRQHNAVLFSHDFHLPEMLETLCGVQRELHQKGGKGRKFEIH